jgi:multidrug efflux pump subunit AcrA (membrane-fusion protein)
MERRGALSAGFFGALFAIAGATGCASRKAPPPQPAPYVETAVANFGSIQPARRLAGVIAPYQNVAVQSTLAEPASAVYVREGDTVHQGQILAQLDTSDLQAQLQSDLATANSNRANTTHTVYQGSLNIQQGLSTLRSTEAAVRQAQQTLSNDQKNLARDQNLLAQGYISQRSTRPTPTLQPRVPRLRQTVRSRDPVCNRRQCSNRRHKRTWRSRKHNKFAFRLGKQRSYRRSTASW